jgi:ABC-2 type transport system permease protein
MTATAAATTAADTGRAAPRARFGPVVLAEFTKFRTVRSSFWTLLISAALTVGIGAAFLPIVIDSYTPAHPGEQAAAVAIREGWWFEGLHVGILAVMILGVLVATTEYGTGTIRATLAAVPSRLRVLTAKVVAFTAVALVAGAVQAYAAFLAARPILADRGIDVPLTDPDALRGVTMATLAIVGAGLFGLGAGLLIRHTAGAIGAVVAVMWVVTGLALLLPDSWADVRRALPANALYGMFTPSANTFAVAPATAVFFGYLLALVAVAAVLLHRRDT